MIYEMAPDFGPLRHPDGYKMVGCPRCGVSAGERCRTPGGGWLSRYATHRARHDASMEAIRTFGRAS